MENRGIDKAPLQTLPIVLGAAVLQGWALYGLHAAVKWHRWPATAHDWLLALYAVAVFVPLTVQLTAEHVLSRTASWLIAALAAAYCYFGWHAGANVAPAATDAFVDSGDWFGLALVLGVLWLLILPFIQCRLAEGTWRVRYERLFAVAWRNKLMLAEAALFTGLFWLLLLLWQELFVMIRIRFFHELFKEPVFVYPVTALAFGTALHLIGSIERVTGIILEQLLNVLKWLAMVAGLILGFFTVALTFRLPGMIESGERAISAAWLLWLVAVTVLLVNAAYRDGKTGEPYPRWIGFALRCVIPLALVIAATAVYAIYLRVDAYGLTVGRVWASIVAAAACLYAIGYAFAAVRGAHWMDGVSRVNVGVALFLIATIALTLTPVLSPYRIAANSQFALAQEPPRPTREPGNRRDTPMHYLRFDAGKYGMEKLQALATLQKHPDARRIRAAAVEMLAQQNRWDASKPPDVEARLASLKLFPGNRSMDAALLGVLQQDLEHSKPYTLNLDASIPLFGTFVDLNADGREEFVFIAPPSVLAYELVDSGWRQIGPMLPQGVLRAADIDQAMAAGDVHVEPQTWQELHIGRLVFRVDPNVR